MCPLEWYFRNPNRENGKGMIKTFFFIERECIEFKYCQYTPAVWRVISNIPPVWKKKESQYTASSRSELENTPPETICTLRPERLPSGNLEGLGVQIASGGVFSNTPLLSVYYYNIFERHCNSQPLIIMRMSLTRSSLVCLFGVVPDDPSVPHV